MNGNPIQYCLAGPPAILQTLSPTILLARQAAMQGFFKRPTAPINVAIDRFVADPLADGPLCHPSCNLLRRPSLGEAFENLLTKLGLPFELMGSTPSMPAQHQLLRALGIVAPAPLLGRLAVALQFTTDRGHVPLQSSGDEAQRFTVCTQPVNLNPLPKIQLLITSFFHRNTFVRCCT